MNHCQTLIIILIGIVICSGCITNSINTNLREIKSEPAVSEGTQGSPTGDSSRAVLPSFSISPTPIHGSFFENGEHFNLTPINESNIPCLSYDLTSHACDPTETAEKKIILQAVLKNSCSRSLLEEGGEIVGVGQVFIPSTGPSPQRTITPENRGGFFPGIFIRYKDMRISYGVDLESRRIISQVLEVLENSSVQEPECNFTSE